jgi:hypothetical protein
MLEVEICDLNKKLRVLKWTFGAKLMK